MIREGWEDLHLLRDGDVSRRELYGQPSRAGFPQAVGGLVVETVAGALTGVLRILLGHGKLTHRPLGGIKMES